MGKIPLHKRTRSQRKFYLHRHKQKSKKSQPTLEPTCQPPPKSSASSHNNNLNPSYATTSTEAVLAVLHAYPNYPDQDQHFIAKNSDDELSIHASGREFLSEEEGYEKKKKKKRKKKEELRQHCVGEIALHY